MNKILTMKVFSQQLIGVGAVLFTFGICGELGLWALPVGIILYIAGLILN